MTTTTTAPILLQDLESGMMVQYRQEDAEGKRYLAESEFIDTDNDGEYAIMCSPGLPDESWLVHVDQLTRVMIGLHAHPIDVS